MPYLVCQKICKECPFLKNSLKGYAGQENNISYLEEIIQMWILEKPFPCHLKIEKNYTFEEIKINKVPLCRGYISMYKNSFKVPRDKILNDLVNSISFDEAKNYLSIFEFKSHHLV